MVPISGASAVQSVGTETTSTNRFPLALNPTRKRKEELIAELTAAMLWASRESSRRLLKTPPPISRRGLRLRNDPSTGRNSRSGVIDCPQTGRRSGKCQRMRHFSIADLARTNHMFLGWLRTARRTVPLFAHVSVRFPEKNRDR
jgi:hypothetical protein